MEKRVISIILAGLLFIFLMAAIFLLPEKKITGYQIGSGGISNSLTITNKDLNIVTNYPVMIGRPFVQGEIPAGMMPQASINGVAVLRTQVDVKNRWPDGSLKFAIISFILPQLNVGETKNIVINSISNNAYQTNIGNSPISSSNMLNNFDFDAVMQLSNSGGTHTISARTMIQNNHFANWLSGSVVTAINLADHSFAAQYDVGWKQQKTILFQCVNSGGTGGCSPFTELRVANASWITVGQILNLNDELVRVQSIDTSLNPDKIVVQRGYTGGLPAPASVNNETFLTSSVWQSLSLPTDDQYRSFSPSFNIYFWPDINKYQVMFIGEISNTEKLQDLTYDLILRTGLANPIVVLSQNGVTQHYASRWGRDFWSGSAMPLVEIDHNLNYLSETKFIPKFDPSIQVPDFGSNNFCTNSAFSYAGWLSANKSLMKLGEWTLGDMGAAGNRPELRWIPCWDALWLHTMDYRAKEVSESQAELSASWPVHFREGNPSKIFDRDLVTGALGTTPALGRVVSPTARPSISLRIPNYGEANDRVNFVSRATHGEVNVPEGWTTSDGHYYNTNYISYLLTGRLWDYQEMEFWASHGTLETAYSRGPNANILGGWFGALTNPNGARYQARPMTQRIYFAQLAVDGTPEDILFDRLIIDAIEAWMGMQNIPLSQEPTLPQNLRDTQMWQFGRDLYSNSILYAQVTRQNLPHPLHFWTSGPTSNCVGNPINPSYLSGWCEASWMIDIFASDTFGSALDLGLPVGSLLDYITDYYTWHFNTPGISPYSIGSYRELTVYPTGVTLTTPQEVWNAFTSSYQTAPCFQAGANSCDTSPYEGDGYFSFVLAAAANIYDYDPSIYNWMRAEAQSTFNAGSYNRDPTYAIVPRSLGLSCNPNQQYNCVSGLFGVCSSGQTLCNSQGSGYGVCTSNIFPSQQQEICDGNDNDCDGAIDEGCPSGASSGGGGSSTGSAVSGNAVSSNSYGGIDVSQNPSTPYEPTQGEDQERGSGTLEPSIKDGDIRISGRATNPINFDKADLVNIVIFIIILSLAAVVYVCVRRIDRVSEQEFTSKQVYNSNRSVDENDGFIT